MASWIWVKVGSGNGLFPVWCQAITWNYAVLLSTGPIGVNLTLSEICIKNFHSRKCIRKCNLHNVGHLCLGLNMWNLICFLLLISYLWLNSLAPGRCGRNLKLVISKLIWRTDILSISCETALIWMSLDFTDDQSSSVQVMAWCHQAPSHYLRQCWCRSMSPYDATRPQWVNVKKTHIHC